MPVPFTTPPLFRFTGPLLITLGLMTTGCSTISNLYGWANIHQSTKGSVYLQEVADWSFKADHPATIDQATLLSAVQGIVAEDVKTLSTNLPAGGSKPMRVFSDEDAEFLAPLLAQGLSQAKPEQIVGFTVSSSAGSGAEPAAGTLYLSRGSLYLTLTPTADRKPSGFTPTVAARIERAPAYTSDWTPGTLAMVINPQILAKSQTPGGQSIASDSNSLTATSPRPDGSAGSSLNIPHDELQLARESNKIKDAEISALRKEVEWMKQELNERSANMETVSKRSQPKRKSAEAYPNR